MPILQVADELVFGVKHPVAAVRVPLDHAADALREEIRGQRAMIWVLIGILEAAVGAKTVDLPIQVLK